LDSGDAGSDDNLREKCGLGVGHASTEKENRWVQWVYTVPDLSLARLKVRLVAKSYSQVYELDYVDIFSPVAKMTFV